MTKITRITTQKRRKNRYNIFLDDGHGEKYGFSVEEDVLIEFNLRKGLSLDQAMIQQLEQRDTFHKAYALAINYLSYRMRTKKELYDYLVKKEVDDEHIPKIMDRLEQEHLLDDRQFAEAFVQTRIQTSSKGPLLIKKELIEKGVAASIADNAIQSYSYETQLAKAEKWVTKKLNHRKKDSFQNQIQKLQTTLMQKGFSQDVMKEVTSDLYDEKDDESEWTALQYHGEKMLRKYKSKYTGFKLEQKLKEALYRKGFSLDDIQAFIDSLDDD
ncbi:recombination regulator RecX [Oceanobacillus halotolerans]|uniref:recombination regulator RecX n=1 Tax=Oceanobacillus halotolerans TaxID=2663380 RepID=UPI0013D9A5A4|nr:recombination regulator RecX [Oceanobacillus halotolerans]